MLLGRPVLQGMGSDSAVALQDCPVEGVAEGFFEANQVHPVEYCLGSFQPVERGKVAVPARLVVAPEVLGGLGGLVVPEALEGGLLRRLLEASQVHQGHPVRS